MPQEADPQTLAGALQVSIGLFLRRIRQAQSAGDLTVPESSALARLDWGGPTTAGALAKLEQISPQSMGATLGALETRGLVARRADPDDGRRNLLSLTDSGLEALRNRRNARTEQLAGALASGFTRTERQQLMTSAHLLERLAQSI